MIPFLLQSLPLSQTNRQVQCDEVGPVGGCSVFSMGRFLTQETLTFTKLCFPLLHWHVMFVMLDEPSQVMSFPTKQQKNTCLVVCFGFINIIIIISHTK